MELLSTLAFVVVARANGAADTAPGTWVGNRLLTAAAKEHQIPNLKGESTKVVLPLELETQPGESLSPQDREWYRTVLLPTIIADNATRKVETTIFINLLTPSPTNEEQIGLSGYEQTSYSAYQPTKDYRFLNESGLQKRFANLGAQLANLSKAGPYSVAANAMYAWYPLLSSSEETREFWVKELRLDPVDLTNFSPAEWDAQMRLLSNKSREAYTAFAEASRRRFKAFVESECKKNGLPKLGILERATYADLPVSARLSFRYSYADFVSGEFASRAWFYIYSSADIQALQSVELQQMVKTLPSDRGVSVVFANQELYKDFQLTPGLAAKLNRIRTIDFYTASNPKQGDTKL